MEFLAWPLAVVILGFGFMLLFREPVKVLLARTKSVGKSGLETFEAPQLSATAETKKPDALAEFMGGYDNPLLADQEAIIEADLQERGLTGHESARRALVRSLATFQILLLFEHVQGAIWASQIDALTYLNSRPNGLARLNEIRPFYEQAKKQYPDWYTDGSLTVGSNS